MSEHITPTSPVWKLKEDDVYMLVQETLNDTHVIVGRRRRHRFNNGHKHDLNVKILKTNRYQNIDI